MSSKKTWGGGFKRAFEEVTENSNPAREERSANEQSGGSSSSTAPPPDAAKRFRNVMANHFLSNRLSALETHEIIAASTAAGSIGSEDLARAGASGKQHGNLHRDLLRGLLKDSIWPREYMAEVSVRDPDTNSVQKVSFPFLLPHEVLHHLLQVDATLLQHYLADADSALGQVIKEACEKTGLDEKEVLAIGLHGDGAPFSAKMKDSLEQFSWNLCSDPKSTRILFTAVPKSYTGPETYEDILKVWQWSLQCLASGKMPTCRHDGTAFSAEDRKHAKCEKSRVLLAGDSIGCRALLLQVRGDWCFYKQVFNLPSWSSEYICWLCKATRTIGSPCDFRTSAWRNHRYKSNEFKEKLVSLGLLSIIFQCPGFDLKHIMIDWLHAVDLGVSQTVLGNLFNEIIDLLPGSSRQERVAALWLRMKNWYKETKPPSKLDALTPEMVKLPGKKPKLRSKAAECRYLLPFARQLAQEFDNGTLHRNSVNMLVQNLVEVSECINTVPYNAEKAAAACSRMCRLHVALEKMALAAGDIFSWSCKPKLHMMEELICFVGPEFGSPRNYWTYQDESWGGWLSHTASRRGGPKFAATTALNLIHRYRAIVQSTV